MPLLPVRDSGLVDADRIGELLLGELQLVAKIGDSSVNRAVQTTAKLLPRHVVKVDQRSTFCKCVLSDDLPPLVKRSEFMGDKLHKDPPPDDEEEDVTPEFRILASRQLELNDLANRNAERKFGDPGYLISNRSELADAVDTDKTMINKIIGPKKSTTKVKLVDRSAFVGRIRKALDLPPVMSIVVPVSHAALLKRIAALPADAIAVYEKALPPKRK